MDNKKSPKKKADGIRRHTDLVRSRNEIPKYVPAQIPEKIIPPKREILQPLPPPLPEKNTFLERSGSSIISSKSFPNTQSVPPFKTEGMPVRPLLMRHKNILALCVGLGITFVTALLLSTLFARVTITVKPAVESLQIQDTEIIFNASASEVNKTTRTVPAEFLSFDGSVTEEFPATGSDYVNQKATGRVRIYNAFNTNSQALVATTRFVSDSGVLFRLPKSIIIPAAIKDNADVLVPQFIETDLIADKPGEESNREGEVKLRIPGFKGGPKYDGFYAIAKNGFSGGSVGQGRVITSDDLTKAQENVSKKIFDNLKREMAQKIPTTLRFVDSLSEIAITHIAAPKEKTKIDIFSITVKAVARVFAFRDEDIINLLHEFLLKGDASKTFVDGSADFHYQIKNANYDRKIASVNINGNIKTKKIITAQDFANLAAGKKEGSLIDALNKRRDISTFRVAFFPPWLFSVPSDTRHIRVIIEDPAK